jgi:hypothetical protein
MEPKLAEFQQGNLEAAQAELREAQDRLNTLSSNWPFGPPESPPPSNSLRYSKNALPIHVARFFCSRDAILGNYLIHFVLLSSSAIHSRNFEGAS